MTLRTYGVLVALAFLAAMQIARVAAVRRRIPEGHLLDLVAVLVLSGLLGARLFYVVLNAAYYRQHLLDALKIWEGGLVFYGGFIAAAVTGVFFVRRWRLSLGSVADCLAPAIAVGQAIGRWGCFFAGCCYGRATSIPWAVRYQDSASLAPLGIDLHPVQLYESFGDLLIALFLWIVLVRRPNTNGNVFWLYTLLYGLLRFGLELLRGDERGPGAGGLSPSQLIALGAVLVSSSILIARAASQPNANA
jgi:phosphatidylglycerol:prolipoprotein diacylglycerol transferase